MQPCKTGDKLYSNPSPNGECSLNWPYFWLAAIDTESNLVFWSCFLNKLEPWHNVYIIEQ